MAFVCVCDVFIWGACFYLLSLAMCGKLRLGNGLMVVDICKTGFAVILRLFFGGIA